MSHYWYKYWLLGRLYDLHHSVDLRELEYTRYQFGFGHSALEKASVPRLPESEVEPVDRETRDTEAAPITERPTTLRPPRIVFPPHPRQLTHSHLFSSQTSPRCHSEYSRREYLSSASCKETNIFSADERGAARTCKQRRGLDGYLQ